MPTVASRYEQFAEFCIILAEQASPTDRSVLWEIADVWLALAADKLPREKPIARQERTFVGALHKVGVNAPRQSGDEQTAKQNLTR